MRRRTTRWQRACNAWVAAPEVLRLAVVIAATILLAMCAGCATAPTTAVKVPVPIVCQEKVPDRPAMPADSLDETASLDSFVQAATAEIERRDAYEVEMRAALVACTKPLP
jgi:hypothetical protein